MTWKRLLADDRVVHHSTTREELTALRGAAERNLADAALPALSTDKRTDVEAWIAREHPDLTE